MENRNLCCWLAILSSGLVGALPLGAQTAPTSSPRPLQQPDEAVRLEAFTVTGTNLRQTESEAALPVTTISRAEMDLRGASTPADEELLDAETRRQLAAGVPIQSVNLGSGTAAYQGNPRVRRAPVSASDQAFFTTFNTNPNNANQRRAPVGPVIDVAEEFVNIAGRDLEGIDFGAEYRVPRSQTFGHFTLRGEAAYRHKFLVQETPGAVLDDQNSINGNPKWRFNTSLLWRKGNLSAGWLTSYYGSFVDTSAATTLAVFEALGRPNYIDDTTTTTAGTTRYVLKIQPTITHNLTGG